MKEAGSGSQRVSLCIASFCLFSLSLTGCGKSGAAEEKKDTAAEPVAVEMTTPEVRAMEETIPAQGTLTAGQGSSAKVAPIAAGRLAEVRVREGDVVSAGQVLAVVDNRTQQAQAVSASAAVRVADAQTRQSELGANALATDNANAVRLAQIALRAALIDRESANQQAQNALETAQADLRKTRAGARPQEITQAEQTIATAQATRDRARTEQERQSFLVEKGIAARRQLDDANAALSVADAGLKSAQESLSLLKAGARAEDLRTAELRVQQAQDTVQQAKRSGDAKIAQAKAALTQAQQAQLLVTAKRQETQSLRDAASQKRADLNAAQITAQISTLVAPLSGVVTRRTLNPGDIADTTTSVIEIADLRELNLLATLTADNGQKIRPGMAARITLPEAPDRSFTGRVLNIGQVDPQTNLMTVRIAVANTDAQLKVGTFASAAILLRREPNALTLPKSALLTHEGKTVVFVVSADSAAHEREVKTGVEEDERTEILSGLKVNERVVLLGQYELTDGAKVKETEKPAAKKTDTATEKTDAKPTEAKP